MTGLTWVAGHRAPRVWLYIHYRFAPGFGPELTPAQAMWATVLMRACDVGWLLLAVWFDRRTRRKAARLGIPAHVTARKWRRAQLESGKETRTRRKQG